MKKKEIKINKTFLLPIKFTAGIATDRQTKFKKFIPLSTTYCFLHFAYSKVILQRF